MTDRRRWGYMRHFRRVWRPQRYLVQALETPYRQEESSERALRATLAEPSHGATRRRRASGYDSTQPAWSESAKHQRERYRSNGRSWTFTTLRVQCGLRADEVDDES